MGSRRARPTTPFRLHCYHPLFIFNQFGDLEQCRLRPGNVHSVHGCRDVLAPVISTELAAPNLNSIVFDLPTTIAKVVACGMPLADALTRSTIGPASKLDRDAEIGDLREGSLADIAIFDVEEGAFPFDDFFGNQVTAPRRLINRLTLREGETLQAPGRETEGLDVLNRANPWRNYGD